MGGDPDRGTQSSTGKTHHSANRNSPSKPESQAVLSEEGKDRMKKRPTKTIGKHFNRVNKPNRLTRE